MAFYNVKNGNLTPVAGGTLYADCPVGTILAYGGATPPAGWFICDGTALNRTSFAELFSIIGTQFGSGNGSTTFNIPDMREMVPRGAGTQQLKTVGNHNAKNVGEFQDDQIQDHWHRLSTGSSTIGLETTSVHAKDSNIAILNSSWGQSHTADYALYGATISDTRTGNTTEVKSIGVNYIIKATRIAVPADFVNSIENTLSDMGIGTVLSRVDNSLSIASKGTENFTLDITTGKWVVTTNVECNSSIDTLITTSLSGNNSSIPSTFVGRFNALYGGGICLTQVSNVSTNTATATLSVYNDSTVSLTFRCKICAIRVA